MGKKCLAPKCRSGYAGVDMNGISMHKFRERWKEKFPRGGEWNVTCNSYICSKHFTDSDFVTSSLDKTTSRVRKRNSTLKHKYLKENAYPTVFPKCPQYLSKKKPKPRTSNTTSSERKAIVLQRLEDKKKQEQQLDSIKTLKDIECKLLTNHKHSMLHDYKFNIGNNKITIYGISIDNEGFPKVKYTLAVSDKMTFKAWHDGKIVPSTRFTHITKCKELSYFNEIIQIVDFLWNLTSAAPIIDPFEEVKYYVEQLKSLEFPNEWIRQKLMFLIEQLELAFMHNKHRRYSSDLLSTCVLWENTSSNLYKQIREEGVLTLPSQRYIQQLTSAISVDTGLTEHTLKYLEARAAKLNEREKIGALLIDEVYHGLLEYTDGKLSFHGKLLKGRCTVFKINLEQKKVLFYFLL